MNTFLKDLATEIKSKYGDQLGEICVVFPTRRAGLFFQSALAADSDKPVWSPKVFSIQDYLLKLSGATIPDPLTLLFELFEVFRSYFPLEEFDKFYPWGELLLKDFDDLDKYMADASKVFATVTDLHRIDEEFGLPEEDMERLKLFWKNFFEHDLSKLKTEFVNTWKNLNGIYHDFKTRLRERNLAYEGMAYRDLAESLADHPLEENNNYSHIVFAGFYALSPAEERVIKFVLDQGKASSFWDTDSYYVDDHGQEAGKFIRGNHLLKPGYLWKREYFKEIPKTIQFTGIPLMVGQAKYAGQLLDGIIKSGSYVPERTAVVLPDEKLLFPVLYSIPEEAGEINVTMGYPLRQTPLFNLFDDLIALQKNARKEKEGGYSFYFRDVKRILDHTYIRLVGGKPIQIWLSSLKDNYIRISSTQLKHEPIDFLLNQLFTVPANLNEVFLWAKQILRMILEAMKEQDFRFHRLESEFVYTFFTQLKRLEDILLAQRELPSVSTFWKIFREIISSIRIPFSGEPLKGLQVMGFLETRVLDFENVILLSVNEDVLPAGGNSPSFIPFNIRKAFGLPTFEEQHAVSAFHFYRLLQRAKNIFLLHNTEAKALTAGERSRFLLQIEHELQRKYPDTVKITRKVITTPIRKIEGKEISIAKDEAVLKELGRFVGNASSDAKSKLSASGLQSYISCSLRFYFRYLAGISEPEEMEENMEAATFGKVLHKAMQTIYSDVIGVDKNVIGYLRKKIDDIVDQAIHEEFVAINQLEGKNILFRNVIRELVNRILEADLNYTPFTIKQLEKDVSRNFAIDSTMNVKLYGIIDRVDEKVNVLRIVDYKTGRVDKRKPADIAELFAEPKLKEQFQAMYYAYLTSASIPGQSVKSGLMALRSMGEGTIMLNNDEAFTAEQFAEFEAQLRKLILEILSPEFAFTQTKDESRCVYCAYREICER